MLFLIKETHMKKLFFTLAFTLLPLSAHASQCDQFFPNGKEIVVLNTTVLCNSFFVSVFNTNLNGVVFSSEIAQERLVKATRTNDFRPDKRILKSPTPDDYTNSGYDRGHMVPAADADDQKEMSDTFLMTNMTPQLPSVNRVAWKNLEDRIRSVPFKYVLTGALYDSAPKTIGVDKVPVPNILYKVAYFDSGNIAVYIVDNVKDSKVRTINIDELEKLTGYKLH
jgi:endonuclease G